MLRCQRNILDEAWSSVPYPLFYDLAVWGMEAEADGLVIGPGGEEDGSACGEVFLQQHLLEADEC